MGKLSSFIIGMLVFSLFLAAGFTPFLADLNDKYDGATDYNETRLEAYNKLSDISDDVEGVKDKATELQSKSGVLDVLGGFFESAYDALKVGVGSFSVFNSMSDQAFDDIEVANSDVFKSGLLSIVIIAIFLGIIIAAVVKRDI